MVNSSGPLFIHLELTSRCNKDPGCWMCGRRELEREHPDKCDWGDMDYGLVKKIAAQVPPGIVVQFHNNGEPLLYPYLASALALFANNIRCLNTNGKLLVDKAKAIVGHLETLTVSVIENDPEGAEQFEMVNRFLALKGKEKPMMIYRLLGDVDLGPWERLGGIIARRSLHDAMGSYKYSRPPTVPEIGICLDVLTHLAIDRYGMVSPCVRFDPERVGVIGNANRQSLKEIWGGLERQWVKGLHILGERKTVLLCSKCDYWGVPTG